MNPRKVKKTEDLISGMPEELATVFRKHLERVLEKDYADEDDYLDDSEDEAYDDEEIEATPTLRRASTAEMRKLRQKSKKPAKRKPNKSKKQDLHVETIQF